MRDLKDLTDEELVELFKAGNEWCFDEIYERYYNKMFIQAYYFIRSKEDAQEIADDALLNAFLHMHGFRGESKLSSWLYRILHNQICNQMRMKFKKSNLLTQSLELINHDDDSIFTMAVADWELPENRIIKQETEKLVVTAIDNLPEVLQKTARMYIVEQTPLNVIASGLNCPAGTVRSRTFRIRKHIQRSLDNFK